ILSRGQSSRLYQSLVYERQLASSASLFAGSNEEAGTLTATVIVAQGQDIDAAEDALDAELERMRATLVTDAELAEAKTEIVTSELRQRETASGRAFILGQGLVSENDPRAADQNLAAIQAVTAADVQRVARQYLDDQARVSIRYLDESQRPDGVPEDSWRNPAPMPTFLTVPPAVLPPNELRPEGERDAPPAPGAPREIPAPTIVERTLANGLRVIAATSTDLPIASAQLVIGGGAASDPADRAGLSEFTAGLATQGAGGRTAVEIARTLEAAGAQIGGGAGSDGTVLSASMPIASASIVAEVLGDVVTEPTFAEAELNRSRTRTVNALRVNFRQPGPIASAVLDRLAYGASPYGQTASGTPESVGAITREDVEAYHERWWRPDNAALVITGGMTPEQAFAFAEEALGDWQAPAEPTPQVERRAGEVLPPRVIVVDMPSAGQAAVTAAVPAPSRSEAAWYPLSVATAVLGAGQNGHLFQEVRAKRGLSYGAYASLAQRRDRALLTASTQTKHESAAEVVDIVLAQFQRVIDEPISEQAVDVRETFLTGGFSRGLETTNGLGGFLANTVQLGLPLSEVEAYPQRVRATTAESLRAVAAETLSPDRAYVVVVGDAAQFLEPLRAAHPQVEVISIDDLDLNSPTLGL
ncbi:MAG: M16 family metallopeptidase, partial [Brevundimonas sp.]